MSVTTAVSAIAEALAGLLDPEKREKRILRGAIESAVELLMILRKQGRYKFMSDAKRAEHEIHYQKRFDAWRDGRT